jgi:signal transduction histidine kinase
LTGRLISFFSPHTLQGKLIIAGVLLVIGSLILASGVFVFLTHGKEKQRALDHMTATAPQIHGEFLRHVLDGDSESQLQEYVREAAQENDIRIIMFDYSGLVVEDTGGNLLNQQLQLPPESSSLGPREAGAPSETWHTTDSSGAGLTLVAPFPALSLGGQRVQVSSGDQPAPSGPDAGTVIPAYRIAMAVSENTIARAWLDLLPWLALAAIIAMPFAVGSAIVVARNITRPLSKLTVAADQMAQGRFDIDVPARRHDEVGQLSRAFSTMATNVGETHMQMRALVANVSHDMRTPLTSILGFAQALRGGVVKGEEESKHAGDVIYDEVTKLSERLNDLLLLSEIEAGQALLQREDVDLNALVASAMERVGRFDERNITISHEFGPDVHAQADRTKLERVVENLLDNARKFTPPGGEVRIRTSTEDGKACVELANTVSDFDPEELPKLFERFYRRDLARSGRVAGSGLGLPIARDLTELHGGTLDARPDGDMIAFTMRVPTNPVDESHDSCG